MPITKTMAYKVGEVNFSTFEEAQLHSMILLFADMKDGASAVSAESVASFAMDHGKELVEILTCKPEENKPARKPRSDKGKKRAKEEAINRALQDGKQ